MPAGSWPESISLAGILPPGVLVSFALLGLFPITLRTGGYAVKYLDYDWSLNAR